MVQNNVTKKFRVAQNKNFSVRSLGSNVHFAQGIKPSPEELRDSTQDKSATWQCEAYFIKLFPSSLVSCLQ